MSFLVATSRLLLLLLVLAGCRSQKVAFQFRPAGGQAATQAPDTCRARPTQHQPAAPLPTRTAMAPSVPGPVCSRVRQLAARQQATGQQPLVTRLRKRQHRTEGASAAAETVPAAQSLHRARLAHPQIISGKQHPPQRQRFDFSPLVLLVPTALLILLLMHFPTVTLIVLGVLVLVGIGILIWLTTGHWAYGAVRQMGREYSAARQRQFAAAAQDLQPGTSALLLVILGLLLAFLIVGAIGLLSTASSVGYIVFGGLLALALLAYPLLLFYGLFHKWKKARRRRQYIKSLSR